MKVMRVEIIADDVEDLRAQLIKFAGAYGLQLTGNTAAETPVETTNQNEPSVADKVFAATAGHVVDASRVESADKPAKGKRGPKPKDSKVSEPASPATQASVPSTTSVTPAETVTGAVASPTPSVASTASPAAPTSAGTPPVNPEDTARAALSAVNTKLGMNDARKAVGEMGVQKFSAIPADKYSDFIKVCAKALGREDVKEFFDECVIAGRLAAEAAASGKAAS